MARRWAILVGVAAVGVMALGAQTATSSTGESVDSTPPDLQLSVDKTQKIGNSVKVNASCDEACTVRARGSVGKPRKDPRTGAIILGKLKPASADLGPGETTTLKLKLTKKTRKKALATSKKVEAKVTVRATDAAGNVDTAKRHIRLVK